MDNKLKNNEGIFEKLYNISTKLINGLGIIIIFGMLLLNLIIMGYIKNIHEKVDYRLNYLSVFLIVILITAVLYILVKKDKIKLRYFLIINSSPDCIRCNLDKYIKNTCIFRSIIST